MKDLKNGLKAYHSPQVMDYGNVKQITKTTGNNYLAKTDNSSRYDTYHRTH